MQNSVDCVCGTLSAIQYERYLLRCICCGWISFVFPIFSLTSANNLSDGQSHWSPGPLYCTCASSTFIWKCWTTAVAVMVFSVPHFNRNWLVIHCIMQRCRVKWPTEPLWRSKITRLAAAICIHTIICIRRGSVYDSSRYGGHLTEGIYNMNCDVFVVYVAMFYEWSTKWTATHNFNLSEAKSNNSRMLVIRLSPNNFPQPSTVDNDLYT